MLLVAVLSLRSQSYSQICCLFIEPSFAICVPRASSAPLCCSVLLSLPLSLSVGSVLLVAVLSLRARKITFKIVDFLSDLLFLFVLLVLHMLLCAPCASGFSNAYLAPGVSVMCFWLRF